MQFDLLDWTAPAPVSRAAAAPWTEPDFERLTELYVETNGDVRAIAAQMGRSVAAIWTKASYLGLAVDGNDVKLRKCLGGCDKTFMSPDRGVCICSRCRCSKEIPWGAF
ncbi:hypothetical protein M2171_002567 [Bradyrhizobium japonicum USDA 38]|uniref:hypothetical protein n=1 Tax=Bradyrhizobium japonicum TaxID=375 RepID=UPI00040C291B|nr:hypothetical protein [Bradyrhizobium japonicum]MCS3893434.1 hypothetical protein [Bradyrhizobium japonicum USDA 38]MCS3945948.1 hypothetical protein [Bradyrhizobium japonicum]